MNGRCTYTSPTMTANGVNSSVTGSKPKPVTTTLTARVKADDGPRMIIQA